MIDNADVLFRSPSKAARFALLLLALLVGWTAAGCSRGPKIVPTKGKVLFKGEPLPYGSVMFQPASGQPARSEIKPDGTFVLGTNTLSDGATVGTNRVRVTSYESQSPTATISRDAEFSLGKSQIPKRYTDFDTSDLVVEVADTKGNDVLLELTE
ncbi:MAG: hypothetical protein KDA41_15265 [Planctomycetales bacterium]|nr:hypothetical protein [Planctomycetales bacterium]